jgi:murein DD-endopeptidase MepM/ murein hydrolase activator NlpD
MGSKRFARSDARHFLALLGSALLLAASAVVASSTSESAEGTGPFAAASVVVPTAAPAGAVVAEPFPDESAVAGVEPEAVAALQPAADATAPPPAAPTLIVSEGELGRGDTLGAALHRSNVSQNVIHLVTSKLSKIFNFRHAQPGHSFRLVQDLEGELLDFRYRTNAIDSIHLALEDGGYVVRREEVELTPRISHIAGVVDSNLYTAMRDLGEEPRLANDFTDVFAWDVDFSRTVQSGDEFRVLYERLYYTDDSGAEVYAGPGRILAARYGGAVGEHTAIYYEAEEGRGGYYRPDGSSVERSFLLAPLRYSRISSSFSSKRRHPILKVTRPHHGIDYAARTGSSVWSVADGEVIYRGWGGGFGNLVKIRHANGYVSYYAHLSHFAAGLRVGDQVQQKQVIGYVGQTGLATGPHVCFRVAKDGRYVNPARVRSPAAKPISEASFEAFIATRDVLLSELDAGPFVASGEAL